MPWAFKYPRAWTVPLRFWLSDFMKWLMGGFDLGLFTFKEATRFISWLVEQPYSLVKSLLSTQASCKRQGSYAVEVFPRLSWIALLIGVVLLGRYAKDWKLAALVGLLFPLPRPVRPVGQRDGDPVVDRDRGPHRGRRRAGVGHRRHIGRVVSTGFWCPILDLMQTVPVFAYLVPVLILFGFSPVAAMIATIIYAMPPMVRVTILALHQVSSEVSEAGAHVRLHQHASCCGRFSCRRSSAV